MRRRFLIFPGLTRAARRLLTLAISLTLLWTFSACHQPYDPANPGGMPPEHPVPDRAIVTKPAMPEDISNQTQAQADAKSAGCKASNCHAGIEEMHSDGLPIGCTDCHGGIATAKTKETAHVHPLYPEDWPKTGQLPVRSYSMLNNESPEFVRFVNPGDLARGSAELRRQQLPCRRG